VVDRRLLGERLPLYQRLVGPQGGYQVIFERDDIAVAKRRRPETRS